MKSSDNKRNRLHRCQIRQVLLYNNKDTDKMG